MEERSEEQTVSRLLDLENDGLADQRAELTGERFLSLIQDPDTGQGYVLRHPTDPTEGAEVPDDTELWAYPTFDEAERAYGQLISEAREAGELVDEDSDDDLGESETDGAEVRGRYSASDEDPLVEEEGGVERSSIHRDPDDRLSDLGLSPDEVELTDENSI
jgi:hypothetical protein